jgi:hypothetical protein
MRADLDLEVNIGYGVTDPQARITRLLFGMESIAKMAPSLVSKIKDSEVALEIFGILGYEDGSRFFMSDEELQQFQQENPPPPSEVDKQIASTEKLQLAKLELDRLVWAERILSDERKKAAELKMRLRGDDRKTQIDLGKESIEIEKLNLDRLGLEYKREDMLRKDAEIKDKERAKLDRNTGEGR